MMDDSTAKLIALIAVVTGLGLAYAKAFGPYQTQLSAWAITAGRVPARYRGPVNLAVGESVALAFTVVGAVSLGDYSLVAVGALAGVFASVEASRIHDAADASKRASPR